MLDASLKYSCCCLSSIIALVAPPLLPGSAVDHMSPAPIVSFVDNEIDVDADDDDNFPEKPRVDALRWGILGTASIAQRCVIPAIRNTEHSKIVAIASRSLEHAQEVAEDFGIPRAYGSYQALLNDPNVQAVYIPLPNHMHKEWTIKAARAGKHILCEKPLALDETECREMIDACAKHNVKLMEAVMYRYHPQTLRVKELVDKGAVGEPRLVRTTFSFPMAALDRDDDYRWQAGNGGGCIYDVGGYCISIARTLFEDEPTSVVATLTEHPEHPGVDAQLHAILSFPGDRTAVMDCSFLLDDRQEYEIAGLDGRVIARDAFNTWGPFPVAIELQRRETTITETIPGIDRFELELDHFYRCVTEDIQPMTDGNEGLRNIRVLQALLKSARTGAPVRV